MSAVTRLKRDKVVPTGKVLVTRTLTIHGLGCHSGGGEDWADEQNALTSAEAQAFKRASSCFGLGRYLYNFTEMWVRLNEYRQPLEIPPLPKWALPKPGAIAGKPNTAAGSRPPTIVRGPIDPNTSRVIEGFHRILGANIYGEILWRIARVRKADQIPNAQLQTDVVGAMERAIRSIRKMHGLADDVGDSQFVQVLDSLQINSIDNLRSLAALKELVQKLEEISAKTAA